MPNLVINKSIHLYTDPAKVWQALTNPTLTKQYFFSCEVISDWQIGSPIIYREEHTIHVKGTITRIKPGEFLEYTYLAEGLSDIPTNYSRVSWELSSENGGTDLTVIQGTFQDQKKHDQSEMGWEYVLKGLKALLQ